MSEMELVKKLDRIDQLERERDTALAERDAARRDLDSAWATELRVLADERLGIKADFIDDVFRLVVARAVTAEAQVAELREMLISHARHRGDCAAFPATSNEQIERDCDCGLSEAIGRRPEPLARQQDAICQECGRAVAAETGAMIAHECDATP